jgi:hypothetical protein
MARRREPPKENIKALAEGEAILKAHPLFSRLGLNLAWQDLDAEFNADAFARLHTRPSGGWDKGFSCFVELNAWRRLTAAEWANVMAQAMLHYYFCHPDPRRREPLYSIACSVLAYDFLDAVGCGLRPAELQPSEAVSLGHDLNAILRALSEDARLMSQLACLNLNGQASSSFTFSGDMPPISDRERQGRNDAIATAIRASVVQAIDKAGQVANPIIRKNPNSFAERARSWFIASYPLLASLAAGFEIIEDEAICKSFDIAIAAVDSELSRVYVNPLFPWTYEGMKFVMAHELLHVGLRHEPRRQGRDPFLWNVACDYVINGWLVSMGVGTMPTSDLLLDPC